VGSGYTIKALEESSWDAFARLVEANNGVFGGCWCMGFHPDDSREPALNRERKLARVQAGAKSGAHACVPLHTRARTREGWGGVEGETALTA
jgi:hypothetical protein